MTGALGLLGPELLGAKRIGILRFPAKGTAGTAPAPPPIHQLPYEPHKFGRLEGLGEKGINAEVEPLSTSYCVQALTMARGRFRVRRRHAAGRRYATRRAEA